MEARENFKSLLGDFSEASGIKAEIDGADGVALEFGTVIVNLQLLPESEEVLAWSTLGFLGTDANADMRAARLLQYNDHLSETGGFFFSFDPEDQDRVLVHDSRPLDFFTDADMLAAWIETLVELVEATRVKIDAECPYVDDDELEPQFEEVK